MTVQQEDLSAAAKALGIQPSDIASTQSAIDEVMLVLQDETPLPDQLRLIKNVSLHYELHLKYIVSICISITFAARKYSMDTFAVTSSTNMLTELTSFDKLCHAC